MDDRTRALIALSSALARGARGEWQKKLSEALEFCTPVEVEEALRQVQIAMDLYLKALREEGKEAPRPRDRRHLPA